MAVIALIFDFDDTLVPDSTTCLLKKHGIDPSNFWQNEWKPLVTNGYDPALAYLKLILDNIGDNRPLGLLKNDDLKAFGAELEKDFYPGLPELFADLKGIVSKHRDIHIEFYIISGGLQEIIEGSKFIRENFTAVYASQLSGDSEDGVLRHVKRCVTFTEKTRYLFEINKGVLPQDTRKNPYSVNREVEKPSRRIPINNMIYVGDGLTDIPCFSLVGRVGEDRRTGYTIGILKSKNPKDTVIGLLAPKRVMSAHFPDYRRDTELSTLIRTYVTMLCGQIKADSQNPYSALE